MTNYTSLKTNHDGVRLVCLVTALESTLVELRLRLPLKRWAAKNGGCVRIISIFEFTPADLGWGDIIIFQRSSNYFILDLIKFLKSHGKKIVIEIDDLLTDLPPFLTHHGAIIENKRHLIDSLQQADAVTVTTPRLGKELSQYNRHIHCVPNCSESVPDICAHHYEVPSHAVTVIVASSDKILVDFIVPALKLAQEKLSVRIITIGPHSNFFADAGLSVTKIEMMPYAAFKSFVASVDNGIGLIPLDESLFSSCKSPIKYFDYSLAGIPAICSNVPPYSDHIINGENGILAENTTESLYSAIEGLALNHSRRSQIVKTAIAYVHQNYGWNTAADAWGILASILIPHIPPNRGEPQKLFFYKRINIKKFYRLAKKIVSSDAYISAYKILQTHGFKGLINRIRRS